MTDTPEFNQDLAEIALDRVRFEEQGKHDQTDWGSTTVGIAKNVPADSKGRRAVELSCGSAGCFAGHTVAALGYRLVVPHFREDYNNDNVIDTTECTKPNADGLPTTIHAIENVAATELGLTSYEADALFAGGNDINDIETIVKKISNGNRMHCESDDPRLVWVNEHGGYWMRKSDIDQ